MTRVLVLAGGESDEREVSLRSGSSVHQALMDHGGYEVELVDYSAAGTNDNILRSADVVFPALHGKGGEDGEIQRRLEALGQRYVGSDAASSELCMDKWQYKQHLTGKLPVAEGAVVTAGTIWQSALFGAPFVLKPVDGGSSVDTLLFHDISLIDRPRIMQTFGRHPELLMEPLVGGIETTVAVLGDQALPVVEIIPPAGGEFDYANKYNGATQELCPPRNVSGAVQLRLQELAVQAHQLCGCRDMSRTDFIVAADGSLTILETNTIPGLTDQSLLPREAVTAGIPMPELCHRLVQMALSR